MNSAPRVKSLPVASPLTQGVEEQHHVLALVLGQAHVHKLLVKHWGAAARAPARHKGGQSRPVRSPSTCAHLLALRLPRGGQACLSARKGVVCCGAAGRVAVRRCAPQHPAPLSSPAVVSKSGAAPPTRGPWLPQLARTETARLCRRRVKGGGACGQLCLHAALQQPPGMRLSEGATPARPACGDPKRQRRPRQAR